MEMGIAVISGNLPLLRPLFEHFFQHRGNTSVSNSNNLSKTPYHSETCGLNSKSRGLRSKVDAEGFERISEEGTEPRTQANSVQDIELGDRAILVKRDFTVVEQDVTMEAVEGDRMRRFASKK
jgi:hypothetical protein